MTENNKTANNTTAPSPQEEYPLPGEYEPQPGYEPPDEQEQFYREYVGRRRECLAAHVTPEVLAYMDEEFRTDLPCYQTRDPLTGQTITPNPLAAAIRDGQREVILWLRHEIAMHRKQKNAIPL
ncbi:hypothetical protein CXU22_03565 [Akkermansia muciniphila]|uniref:Uncharacterized protein n=1 Tax=Akkermansia muciniphila TaxID=239935 RepID=A0A2N8HF26_9BACT|nr:hypothetical protein [Akkermansia muciniphila]PNC18887.1 hypothetical protein CXU22_03565 [Akkermansia muciniphila]